MVVRRRPRAGIGGRVGRDAARVFVPFDGHVAFDAASTLLLLAHGAAFDAAVGGGRRRRGSVFLLFHFPHRVIDVREVSFERRGGDGCGGVGRLRYAVSVAGSGRGSGR